MKSLLELLIKKFSHFLSFNGLETLKIMKPELILVQPIKL